MAIEVWADDAIGTVSSGGTTAPSPGTSESWTVTPSIAFAVASSSASPPTQFYVADIATGYPTEKMLVTICPGGTSAGQSWTVTRGADGTTPIAHTSGFTVQQVVTAGTLKGLLQAAQAILTGMIAPAVVTLTDASTVTPNCLSGNDFRLLTTSAVGGSRTIAAPTNAQDGMRICFQVTQPASGGPCTITWSSSTGGFNFGAAGAPTLSTAASKLDIIGFIYNATKSQWIYCGPALGN